MKLSVTHTIRFSLGAPLRAVQHLLLTPLATPQQRVERWSIDMPGFADAPTFRDGYGNKAHMVSELKPEPTIAVRVAGTVETFDKAGVIGRLEYDPMPALFRRTTEATKADPELIEGLGDGPDRIALFHELMGRVHERADGQSQVQDGQAQSQGAAMSAPELAHALVAAVRGLGIPARYVTGYLLDDDIASFHAWAELWDEKLGWIGFDPLLNLCPTESHVRVASGLDATSTMPIRSVPVWGEMPAEIVEIVAN
jgi:hypothetical protein